MLRSLMLTASLLSLAACAQAQDRIVPTLSQSATGPFIATSRPELVALAPGEDKWWRLYEEPVLDQLIADALAANTDIRQAAARVVRARAMLRERGAERAPQLSVSGAGNYGRLPQGQRPPGAAREDWQIDAGLSVAYEADLFGRLSSGVRAARSDLAASEADADVVRVAIAAETARAYFDAASAAERLAVAERIVTLLDRSIALTKRREDAGLATRLDVARIAALRNQRQADVPTLRAERQSALFRLAMLTGRTLQDLPEIAAQRVTSLALNQPIPVGDGAALLARRPDIRAAERRLDAATARIGVASADLYPRITLGGSIGGTGNAVDNLLGAGPLRWLVGGLLNWTFNRGPARARVEAAKADGQGELAAFDGAVLRAIQETETALAHYASALDRQAALRAARADAEAAVKITRARQAEGQIDFLELLDAERTFADSDAQLAAANGAIGGAQIDLFRALGGGWSQ